MMAQETMFLLTVAAKHRNIVKNFLGVRTGVNEIPCSAFWNVTPLHWVMVPDLSRQPNCLIFQGSKGPSTFYEYKTATLTGNIENQTSSDDFKQVKVTFFLVYYVKKYRGSGDMAALILNLGTRRRCLNSHPGSFAPAKEPRCLLNRRLAWSRSRSGRFGDYKNNLHLPTFEPRTLKHIAYSLYRMTTL
jgi:hypothetical protein